MPTPPRAHPTAQPLRVSLTRQEIHSLLDWARQTEIATGLTPGEQRLREHLETLIR